MEDLLEDGRSVPGGPSLYAALTVRALGAHPVLVTNLAAGYDRSHLAGIEVLLAGEAQPPRYENRVDACGRRTQRLLGEGGALASARLLETLGRRFDKQPPGAVLACPAFHEIAGMAPSTATARPANDRFPTFGAPVLAACLQGVLRRRLADGRVAAIGDARAAVAGFVRPGALLVFSEEDATNPGALAATLADAGAVAALTRGERGVAVYTRDGVREWTAFPATPLEPTGAGDCFAAALTVRYAETRDLAQAVRWGLAAGAIAVESRGLAAVPTRAALVARLAEAA
ncbi:MAG: hypothetical protein IT304_02300 [Dehalococcoidia bacterium]|nr:hypothetical protein [Dehalococcoidia bacterium]